MINGKAMKKKHYFRQNKRKRKHPGWCSLFTRVPSAIVIPQLFKTNVLWGQLASLFTSVYFVSPIHIKDSLLQHVSEAQVKLNRHSYRTRGWDRWVRLVDFPNMSKTVTVWRDVDRQDVRGAVESTATAHSPHIVHVLPRVKASHC